MTGLRREIRRALFSFDLRCWSKSSFPFFHHRLKKRGGSPQPRLLVSMVESRWKSDGAPHGGAVPTVIECSRKIRLFAGYPMT